MSESGEPIDEKVEIALESVKQPKVEDEIELTQETREESQEVQQTADDIAKEDDLKVEEQEKQAEPESEEVEPESEKENGQDPLQDLEPETSSPSRDQDQEPESSSQSKDEDQNQEQDQGTEQIQDHEKDHKPDQEHDHESQHTVENIEEDQDPLMNAEDDSRDTVPMTNTSDKGLDDEEMPSMVNLSSPSRIDESELGNKESEESRYVDVGKKNSPPPQQDTKDDSDSDVVCIIDDDDDEPNDDDDDDDDDEEDDEDEEDEVGVNGRQFRRMEEDEEDYSSDECDGSSGYDDSEEDRQRYRDRNDRKPVPRDIEEDDEEEYDPEHQDEYMDEELYDYRKGGSDDIVLRHSNGFSKENTERSSSLQDLSVLERPLPKTRPTVNPFFQKAIFERNQTERKPVGKKYDHVNSKVKEYILEQKRRSTERRRQVQEEARQSQEPYEPQPYRNEELVSKCREMKEYAVKELQEVADCEEDENVYGLSQGIENGDISIFPRRSTVREKIPEEMEIDPIDDESHKEDKINGAQPNNHETQRKGIFRRDEHKTVLNGEDPLNPIYGVHTLTYDEYMKGSTPTDTDEIVNHVEVVEEMQYIPTKKQNNDACTIKIESVTSHYENIHDRKTPVMDQSVVGYYPENIELTTLRSQLNERNSQFEHLKQAYQKTLATNMTMQMELENLKKTVTQLKEQQKPTKELAIQTERDMPIIDLENDPKATTMSSQWSESTCSAAISMDQPNVTAALASDESTKLPPHKKNALSRAFMTSTKILQTLSSITYGRTKVDKTMKPPKITVVGKESEKQTLQPEVSNSKKRKASDADEICAPPSKISKPDSQETNTRERPTTESDTNKIGANKEVTIDKDKIELETLDDDVKVFVYSDDSVEKGEHSFLIQAKEVGESVKPGVRECGPYLLGNIEVYMTEMNGTINIWGKELSQGSQETTSQNVEELDTSTKSKDLRQGCFRWQSTPRIFNNEGSASTSKKSRVQPRFAEQSRHSCDVNTVVECEHCNPHSHRLSWPSCNQSAHENQHTCCSPSIRIEDTGCGCAHKMEKTSCCKSNRFVDVRTFSMPNVQHSPCCCNHSHCRNRDDSHIRHQQQSFVRRHSFNPTDEENESGDEDANRTLISSQATEHLSHSHSKNKLTPNSTQRKSTGSGNSTEPSSCDNETDPLISQRQSLEVPEGRKRRSSKGRVRGLLMDLLKGCGDCKATPVDKNNPNYNASVYEPSTSKMSCPPNMPSCTSREKCSTCSSSSKKDVATEIAVQLESFQAEMEKLRSRSDTLHQMLDRLRNDNNPNV